MIGKNLEIVLDWWELILFMAYRHHYKVERQRIDWAELFEEHYADDSAVPVLEILPIMRLTDNYIPDVSRQFTAEDLSSSLKLILRMETDRLLLQDQSFADLVRKAAVLALENNPEEWRKLNKSDREVVLNSKLRLPDERAMYAKIYSLFLGSSGLPLGMADCGEGLDDVLGAMDRAAKSSQGRLERIDPELMRRLCQMDAQYRDFFGKKVV